MERESFVFYRSFFETIAKVRSAEAKAEAYEAIALYGLYGIEPGKLSFEADLIFGMAKPQLEANFKRAMNGAKGAAYGSKGGRPKTPKDIGVKEQNPLGVIDKTPKDIGVKKKTPNVNVNVNDNANVNVNENEKGIVKGKEEQPKPQATTPAPTSKDPEIMFTFGEFQNVQLTDMQHKRLVEKYGVRETDRYIEKLSSYMASTGKKYKNHLAVLTGWMSKDSVPEINIPKPVGGDLMTRAMQMLEEAGE